MKTTLAAIVAALVGAAALAHTGASGAVMERMMGMSAMQEVVRNLAPMMRGEAPYDAAAVRAGATTLMAHSGNTMTALFPEGADMTASYARPEIWAQWNDFEMLSAQLYLYAAGLTAAAPNGLETPASAGEPSSPQMAETVPDGEPPRLTVAQLMGVEARPTATGVTDDVSATSVDFASMAADDVFELMSQTCSSCHARFRTGN